MAEDPGSATIAAIIEAMRRAAQFAFDTTKTAVSTTADVVRTGMYLRFRRQMNQGAGHLKHGKQSLRRLRQHEDRGATLASATIGGRDAMKALDAELKTAKIDYAITRSASGEYTLHYKTANEQDVLRAQSAAIEALYGSPRDAARPGPDDPTQTNEQISQEEQGQRDAQQQQVDQQQQQQEQVDLQEQQEQLRQQEQADQEDQATPQQDEQQRAASQQQHDAQEQQRSQGPVRQAEHDRQTREMLQQQQQTAGRVIPAVASLAVARAAVPRESLDDLKKIAKQRAAEKNKARALSKGRAHTRTQERKTRSKAREYTLSH